MAVVSREAPDFKLQQIEIELDKLKTTYEQYFSGVLRREPIQQHENFKKLFQAGSAEQKTTSSKFRFQSIQARYIQLNTLWLKVLKQIEEGTYKRDLFLLDKKKPKTAESKVTAEVSSPNPDPSLAEASKPKSGLTPSAKNLQKAPPPSSGALNSAQLENIYEKMKASAPATQKIPSKEVFIKSVQSSLKKMNERSPGESVKILLQKDSKGEILLKLTKAPKT